MDLNRDLKTSRDATVVPWPTDGAGEVFSDTASLSDLPRFCLERDTAEAKRTLAWVNSICLAYLIIGIMGLNPPAPEINRRPSAPEEAVPTVIEPLIAPVQAITAEANPEEAPEEKNSEGAGVAVTADSSAIAFSVPTVGNVLVPLSMAQAPPAHPMEGAVAINRPHIEEIGVTGTGGSRPPPTYPYESLMEREQGTVVLLIEVDEAGKIASVTVKRSSGHVRLDQAAADQVRRRWFFDPAKGRRIYESPIVFQLQ
jgi:TonB family protein